MLNTLYASYPMIGVLLKTDQLVLLVPVTKTFGSTPGLTKLGVLVLGNPVPVVGFISMPGLTKLGVKSGCAIVPGDTIAEMAA